MTAKDYSFERNARTPGRKWSSRIVVIVIVVVVAGFLLSPRLDSIAVETVRCEVTSAAPKTASGGSRGSASSPAVLIQTSNCGPLEISEGVTFDERQEVASSFEVGAEYDFDIGWFSRVVMKDLLDEIQTVRDYRLAE